MEEENGKLLNGLSGGGAEEGGLPLFSVFHPAPAPAPVPMPPPAPFKAPAPPEKPPPPQDREILDYLKAKLNDTETKLRESQEKGLAFAYELKGREEARKESRREMEEFLAAVKRQQAESETERSHGLELEKARARIEALELKIMEFSTPRPEAPPPPAPGLTAKEIEKLQAGLKAEFSANFELLGAKLEDKFKKEVAGPLAGRLEAENAAREKDLRDMRLLADNIAGKVSRLENAFSKKLADMETLFAGFSSQMAAAEQAAGKKTDELRALAGTSFERIGKVEAVMADEFGKLVSTGEEFRSSLRAVSAGMEAFRRETFVIVESIRQTLQAGGAPAADSAAGRLVPDSAPYELRFITVCLDNLEKALCAAVETLARTSAAARKSAGTGADAAFDARRQAAMLDSAARDLGLAVEVFQGVALKPIKRILGA